jgi:catechol 2,3-dioxygenase-like lactoylglutathione lyase family enzyme
MSLQGKEMLWLLASMAILAGAWFAWASRSTSRVYAAPARPPIVSVACIGLKVDNLDAARKFYSGLLGLGELAAEGMPGEPTSVYFKVNDHQYIEVFPTLKDPNEDRLVYIAFETTNAQQLRAYLASRGVDVPGKLPARPDKNLGFAVHDPDGHTVEFIQYAPGSLQRRNFGKLLPATRVSERMIHVGATVSDRAAADRFYKDILGFKEFWHGGMTDDRIDWVDMRVPDGKDWFEYMLNVHNPTPQTLGVMNHLALGVPSVVAGHKKLLARGLDSPEKPKIGRDGKWQLSLYDPSLTRTELMEPKPVQTPCCSPMLE